MPGQHVEQHEDSHRLVALGGVGHVVQQAVDVLGGVMFLKHAVFRDGTVEEKRSRIDYLLGLDRSQCFQSFFVDAAIGQRRA